jgi:hypothetical protein
VNCDGTDADIVADAYCSVPITVFLAEPFNMVIGDYIYGKVLAVNIYGESGYSAIGNGATARRTPDAPFNLENLDSVTDADSIGLSWFPGPSNGNAPVVDYRIYYATESGEFEELVSGVLSA